MSERTFWRYMAYATEKFGYEFGDRNNTYLDDVFSKMKPETIGKIKDLADNVLKVKPKGKTRSDIYQEVIDRTGLRLNTSNFNKYLRIAETYLGYQFNFQ